MINRQNKVPGQKQCFAPEGQLESYADKKIDLQNVMSLTVLMCELADGEWPVAGSFSPES